MNKNRQKLLDHININKPEKDLTKKDYERISAHRYLSDKFIIEFQTELNWKIISRCQKLSAKMIRHFQHKLNWFEISEKQIMSEDFIREFQDKLNWGSLSYRTFSNEFLIEFKHRIIWSHYFYSKNVDFLIIKQFMVNAGYKNLDRIKTDHLSKAEIKTLENILAIKYMFTKQETI
jgi:hypothetical protein